VEGSCLLKMVIVAPRRNFRWFFFFSEVGRGEVRGGGLRRRLDLASGLPPVALGGLPVAGLKEAPAGELGLELLLGWRIVLLLKGKVSLPPGGYGVVDGFLLSHGKDPGEMLSSLSKLLGCVVRWVHI
jgi:hypothetical protein